MKITLLMPVIVLAICGFNYNVNAQIVNIPDANFKAYLVGNASINTNLDSEIQTSEASTFSGTIGVSSLAISDLTGIESFTALTTLNCEKNQLSSLNLSANTALTTLDCGENKLTNLDLSANTALTSLLCWYNQLTSLELFTNTALTYLNFYWNPITSIDLSANKALTTLSCGENKLTSLDLSNQSALITFESNMNQFSSLDFSACKDLTTLFCPYCQVETLNISANAALVDLEIWHNQLTSLDISALTALTTFRCEDNRLVSLNMKNGNNINLTTFDASKNPYLSCIEVDDATFMNSNWAGKKDTFANYSNICIPCIVNIPDANFKAALVADKYINLNGDNEIQCIEASKYSGAITVDNKSISDLTGIEAFKSIVSIFCNNNQLTSLDLSANTALNYLYCYSNQLTSLDLSANTALKYLYCYSNQITSLDLSAHTALTNLYCNNNQISSLDLSANTALTSLACNNNLLTSLNLPTNPGLTSLTCNGNLLTSLDLSNHTALTSLACNNNRLTSLNLSTNTGLTSLTCNYNQLTSLDLPTNPTLTSLTCNNNQLTSLDVSAIATLTTLDCYDNQLKSLDLSANTSLTSLYCVNNKLISLNIKNGNNINISFFGATNNPSLSCIKVDNAASMNSKWAGAKDAVASYGIDCIPCNITIPDAKFKAYLVGNTSINRNGDSEIQCAEAVAFSGTIDVTSKTISDLTGIEAFTALTNLTCYNNQLTSLDVSANTALVVLLCGTNKLTSLDLSANTVLTTLDCNTNQLTILNIKNGNNINFSSFVATTNPGLTCVKADDATYMNTNWSGAIDASASYDTNCLSYPCIVNIPDVNFKAALVANAAINTNLDSEIQCSEATAFSGTMNVDSLVIADLTGIEAFTALGYLSFAGNQLTNLDLSFNTALHTLYCGYNQLKNLNISANTALAFLSCNNNQLTSLNVSSNTALSSLSCSNNQLTSLNVSSNTALSSLNCSNNQLKSMSLTDNTSLSSLHCTNNQLTILNIKNGNNVNFNSFDATNNPDLTCIQVDDETNMNTKWPGAKDATASYATNCSYPCIVNIPDANFKAALLADTAINTNFDNEIQCSEASAFSGLMNVNSMNISDLTGIEAFTALSKLYCYKNLLINLDVSANTALTFLYCWNNQLTSLDVSANTSLTNLYCYNNKITSLDLSANTALTSLYCQNNQLASLDISANTSIVILICLNNKLTSLDMKNGNNTNFSTLYVYSNPNLSCIQVDDAAYMNTKWSSAKDATASYSQDCTPCTPIDVSTTLTGETITANATGSNYQWLDCNNGFAIINGETSQSFTANGNYAVEIIQGSCSDTSVCVQTITVGITSIQKEGIAIYPNPVSDKLVIEINGNTKNTNFEILNSLGQIVFKGNLIEKILVPTEYLPQGIYLIKLENENLFEIKKITKN